MLNSATQTVKHFFGNFDTFLLPETLRNIFEIKKKAYRVKKEIMTTLSKEFLPPFEREDIAALTRALNEAICASVNLLQCSYFSNLIRTDSYMKEFSAIAFNCATQILLCVGGFENFAKPNEIYCCTDKITRFLNDAEDAFVKANRNLFTTSCDTKEILIKSRIYETGANSCFSFEKINCIIEDIVLKNS